METKASHSISRFSELRGHEPCVGPGRLGPGGLCLAPLRPPQSRQRPPPSCPGHRLRWESVSADVLAVGDRGVGATHFTFKTHSSMLLIRHRKQGFLL